MTTKMSVSEALARAPSLLGKVLTLDTLIHCRQRTCWVSEVHDDAPTVNAVLVDRTHLFEELFVNVPPLVGGTESHCHDAIVRGILTKSKANKNQYALTALSYFEARTTVGCYVVPMAGSTLQPSWCSSTVLSLAEAIKDSERFDRLAILADALEDAGCTSDLLLDHCRRPGVHGHFRQDGCWVVKMILGMK